MDPEQTLLSRKNSRFPLPFLLILFTFLACFADLPLYELESGDETRVAGISAGILVNHDWLIPRLNGAPFLEYPPLFYWLQAGCFKLFGTTHFAARIPAALSAFLLILAFFFLFSRILKGENREKILTADAFMLLTSSQFFAATKFNRVDILLALFILLAWAGFYLLCSEKSWKGRAAGAFFFWFGLSGGLMTKGPVGLAIPLSSAGVFLILSDLTEKRFRILRYLSSGGIAILALIPFAWWCFLLYRTAGPQAVHTVLIRNSVGRFASGAADHAAPLYAYLLNLPAMFQPWLILTLGGMVSFLIRKKTGPEVQRKLYTFCMLIVPFLLLSIASGKRTVYLLPLAVPAALTAGDFLQDEVVPFCRARIRLSEKLRSILGKVLIFVATALFLSLTYFLPVSLKTLWAVLFPAAGLIFFFLSLYLFFKGKRIQSVYAGLAAVLGLFLSLSSAVSAGRTRRYSVVPLYEMWKQLESEGHRLILINPPERTSGAAVFYLGKNVPSVFSPKVPPQGKEVWVVWTKARVEAMRFPDKHVLIFPGPDADRFTEQMLRTKK